MSAIPSERSRLSRPSSPWLKVPPQHEQGLVETVDGRPWALVRPQTLHDLLFRGCKTRVRDQIQQQHRGSATRLGHDHLAITDLVASWSQVVDANRRTDP